MTTDYLNFLIEQNINSISNHDIQLFQYEGELNEEITIQSLKFYREKYKPISSFKINRFIESRDEYIKKSLTELA